MIVNSLRHPELVSGSIFPHRPKPCAAARPRRSAAQRRKGQTARWMLKRVQHDGIGGDRGPREGSGLQCRKSQADRQIAPVRVGFLDQVDFPLSPPVLELLLAGDRRDHVAVHFEPDQPLDSMLTGKAGKGVFAVLPQSGFEVGSDADVKRAARLARKDVDTGVALDRHGSGCAARWTLKQVQGDDKGKAELWQ